MKDCYKQRSDNKTKSKKIKSDNFISSDREKSNIAITILDQKLFRISGAPIITISKIDRNNSIGLYHYICAFL